MFQEILQSFGHGELSQAEAEARILETYYAGRENFLLDVDREKRLGFPEVVYAEGKQMGDLLDIVGRLLETKGKVYIASLGPEAESRLQESYHAHGIRVGGRAMVIGTGNGAPVADGVVGVITAGTSDVPYAQECVLLLEELGVRVITYFDAGVAGIHRPVMSLRKMQDASVLIVFAGMEGALPTVLASLTDLPVVAVPTPIGYGYGGQGEAALKTMLQSCSPGVTVVNIGNSVGAAAAAVRILRAVNKASA
jgi:NCAIR mutase (PurE)-related protein